MKTEGFELVVPAKVDKLQDVMAFLEEHLGEAGPKVLMKLSIAVEEIFVNIASYAYEPETGKATMRLEFEENPRTVVITFIDEGVPFNPLARPDPDVTLSAEERGIGGLGIFMTKNSVDKMEYEYRDGKNILTLRKEL
ncbi:MAG: ATP-binding protein [Lachnospiraceae bacterium]|nr:ATP-binding protein [Lachnospiraceae bacterium]